MLVGEAQNHYCYVLHFLILLALVFFFLHFRFPLKSKHAAVKRLKQLTMKKKKKTMMETTKTKELKAEVSVPIAKVDH